MAACLDGRGEMRGWNERGCAVVSCVVKESDKANSHPPLEGLTNLAELLAGFTCGALLGALIGVCVGQYLRARGLRWTWALLLVPAVPLVGAAVMLSPLAGWRAALGVGIAAGVPVGAVAWGVYRRVGDHRDGGDHESSARERRALTDPVRQRVRERPAKMRPAIERGIALGRTERREIAWIRRGTSVSSSSSKRSSARRSRSASAARLVMFSLESEFSIAATLADVAAGDSRPRSKAMPLLLARSESRHFMRKKSPRLFASIPVTDGLL
jgi:hypothetical protein